MKKIISLILVALFVLTAISFTACGSINDGEVSILWSGSGVSEVPDSLINCIERAMYIENISYKHYGANNNADEQYNQAKAAAEAGCSILVVELVNNIEMYKYIELAKSSSLPIIFIGDETTSLALSTYNAIYGAYDKCVIVRTDTNTASTVQGKLIADYVVANFKTLDRNGDGKISYANYMTSAASLTSAQEANELLKNGEDYEISIGSGCNSETTRTELVFYDEKNVANVLITADATKTQLEIMEAYNDENNNTVELIITDNDTVAFKVLVALQSKDFNTDKLTTHCIPVFTVGFEYDYKAFVLSNMPQNKDEVTAYLENNKYLCDLLAVEEEDRELMIWNTKNVIASGRLAGTVIEDLDTVAAAIASAIANLINDKPAFDGMDTQYVNKQEYLIPLIAN